MTGHRQGAMRWAAGLPDNAPRFDTNVSEGGLGEVTVLHPVPGMKARLNAAAQRYWTARRGDSPSERAAARPELYGAIRAARDAGWTQNEIARNVQMDANTVGGILSRQQVTS